MTRSASIALFCIAIAGYVLPWHRAAVGDARFGGATGLQMATGKTVSEKGLFGIEVRREVRFEPLAALSLLAALGGAAAGLLKVRRAPAWQASAGALAVILLLLLRTRLGQDAGGIVESEMRAGFFLALVASAVAAGLGLYATIAPREGGGALGGPGEPIAFCPQCGAPTVGGDRFCRSCGAPLS